MMKTRRKSISLLKLFRLSLIALTLALLPVSFPGIVQAAETAGKVNAVAGKVTAAGADGAIRTLTKKAPVFSGDIISTGPNSRVRILFSDESVIFLRPSTRFVIDSYKHTGNSQQDESKFSLVKGGFRSVTGAIGHANKDKVRIETPVATIGIRGTDHEGRYCAGDCLDLTNIGVSAPADGLFTATNVGQTMVGNKQFSAGQYGFTSPAKVTVHLPEPPPILAMDPALRESLAPQQETEEKEKNAPASGDQEEQGVQEGQGEQGDQGGGT
ncbi:FecR domain-containing protein [Thermodesulfobacteriota bacterium]